MIDKVRMRRNKEKYNELLHNYSLKCLMDYVEGEIERLYQLKGNSIFDPLHQNYHTLRDTISEEFIDTGQRGILIVKSFSALEEYLTEEHPVLGGKWTEVFRLLSSLAQFFNNNISILDGYTAEHSNRVAKRAVRIAKMLGLEEEERFVIEGCALLHDIGKINTPDQILSKKERLTPEEIEIIHRHPGDAVVILKKSPLLRDGIDCVRYHHERWDGKGYPDNKEKDEIPLKARILAIADCIDAMSVERPYRGKLSQENIKKELEKNAGYQFDPELIEIVLKNFSKLMF
jgi:putative nucleotidyltransferase with HDIG domain